MRKQSAVWLSLGLSGLAVASAVVATTAVTTVVTPGPAIAQTMMKQGTPLAKQLQGKPVVVDIYASWCPACQNVAPTLSQLKQEYGSKVNFVVLDVSDRGKASQAEARAKQLGLGAFFAANKSQTGLIAILDPATGKVLTQHRNNATKSDYTSVLNAALAKK
jgi:thiol-disulfide isomerase/thioredoxin